MSGPAATRVRPAVVLLGVLALAANLRAALAGYPPLLETVRADLGLSAGVAGLVQAGAVLMMAVGSFAGPALARHGGRERALGVAVGLVAAGSLSAESRRSRPLIGGSLLVGLGIGLAGVLITGVVKEHLAERAGAATGGYVVAMMVGATVSSAVAVPLATLLGGLVVLARGLGGARRARHRRLDADRPPRSRPPSRSARPLPWRRPVRPRRRLLPGRARR